MTSTLNNNIDDAIERCENRLSFLNNKLNETSKTVQSVHASAENAKKLLENHVQQIKESFNNILQSNYESLVDTVDQIAKKDIRHLKDVEEYLAKDVENLKSLIEEAQVLKEMKKDSLLKHINQSLLELGKGSNDSPIISLSFSPKINDSTLALVTEKASDLLKLNTTGSVQIVECLERPGAIVIEWDEQQQYSESESVTTDASIFSEFILQACDDTGDKVFNTIYEGDDTQFTMNFAEPNKLYTFRVCHYHTNGSNGTAGVCGPWSMPRKACTTLAPHVWREADCTTDSDLQLYQLSNTGRTATKIFPESSRILRSKNASYILGQHLTFWIEETGDGSLNDGIGFISQDKQIFKNLTKSELTAVFSPRGSIFVNGAPMTTKLPALKRNSVIVFNAFIQSPGKLRVSITIDDKEVTFDWSVANIENNALYFACGFEHTGWKISVG